MRILASGWGRHHGEKEIMNGPLGNTEADSDGYLRRGRGYLKVVDTPSRIAAKVKVAAGTEEVRLGGRYRLTVEFSREEIAQLFWAVHHGDTVRTFKLLLEEEVRQEQEEAERRANERLRREEAEREKRNLLRQVREKLASPKQPPQPTGNGGS
jgi:hypothetical protein